MFVNLFQPHNTVDDIESPEITTSVFEQTLQECMAKQRDRMPELPIPRILLHLIDAFYVMDGKANLGNILFLICYFF